MENYDFVKSMFKPTRSVNITCSTHTPGGCSLNFAQPLAGQSFSNDCLGVGAGGELASSRARAQASRELPPLRLIVKSLVGVIQKSQCIRPQAAW